MVSSGSCSQITPQMTVYAATKVSLHVYHPLKNLTESLDYKIFETDT